MLLFQQCIKYFIRRIYLLFELIVGGLFGTPSATVFTISIIVLFLFSCLVLLLPNKRQWVIGKAPSLLTTLGLFGTFYGVAIGLGEFDVSNIDRSVIHLISGMKLAFWTSILGMLCAFLLHISQYIFGCFYEENQENEEEIIDIILQVLQDTNQALQDSKQNNSLQNNSLIEEIQKFRKESVNSDKLIINEFKILQKTFNSFANKIVENNSNALIEALERVMRDFNTRINEQFGDNFKQLNQAVGKLLDWQENYKNHLEKLTEQFNIAQSGIENSRKGIEDIKNNLNYIPTVLKRIENAIMYIDKGLKESGETLRAFTALKNQASEVFPTIRQCITDITKTIQGNVKNFESSVNEQNRIIKQLGETSVAITGNVQTALKQGADQVQAVFNESVEKMKQSTLDSFTTFDKQAEENLNKIIQLMGNNLASIHQKLIDDCQSLTGQISILVEAATRRQ